MSTIMIRVAVCACLVLLAAGLCVQFAQAAPIDAAPSGQDYTTLADHLYKATPTDELADNIKAARSLISAHPNSGKDIEQLVQAFVSLKADSSDPESLCSKDNLANLLRVAEGMRDGGNLGPADITPAILRLNKIVIKLISDSRRVCDIYLTGKWPKSWKPKFSDWNMKLRILNLDEVTVSYSYEEYVGLRFNIDPQSERDYQTKTISNALKKNEQQAINPSNPNSVQSPLSEDKTEIAKQLDKYVYKPCAEFVSLDEAKKVLVPFNDLLKSWTLSGCGRMDKYYENKGAFTSRVDTIGLDERVRDLAHGYQACQRFLATPSEDLVERISEFRIRDKIPNRERHNQVGSLPSVIPLDFERVNIINQA